VSLPGSTRRRKSDQHSGQTFERHDEEQEDAADDEDGDREGDADQDEAGGDRSAAASGGGGAEHSSSSQDSAAAGASALPMNVSPSVSMVTKHSNGTLNLWQLSGRRELPYLGDRMAG